MTSLDVQTLTFRELIRKVSLDGLPRDSRPRTVAALAKSCGVSRPHFYTALRGSRSMSDEIIRKIAVGLKKHCKWITEKSVRLAITRTRKSYELNFD